VGISPVLRASAAAIVACASISGACALRQTRPHADLGIPPCPAGIARESLLSADALQCWIGASHGRWRRLNHQSHLQALVVEVEAEDVRDAVEIARRLVGDPMAVEFSEILVYVNRPQHGELRVRRVRWTREEGYETLDYSSPAGDTPLTIRASPED